MECGVLAGVDPVLSVGIAETASPDQLLVVDQCQGQAGHVLPFHFPADVALQIVDDLAVVAHGGARRWRGGWQAVAAAGAEQAAEKGKVHGAKHGIPGGKARCPMLGRAWLAILTALSAICERLLSLRCQRGRSQVRRKEAPPCGVSSASA